MAFGKADLEIILGMTDDAARQLEKTRGNLQKFGQSATAVGKRMTLGLTAPILGMGAAILKAGASFESQMNKVGALTGATEVQMKALEEQAKTLGATTKFSATQAADAMGFLGMAGFNTNEILSAMPGTLELAASANLELGQAADIVSNVLTGYNKETSELAQVNDVLVKSFTSANTDLVQLGQALKFVGPVASSAGLQFEEVAAAIGLLGNAGIQASMAGTSLRGAITRLLVPSGEAVKVMKDLGVEMLDAEGNIKPLVDVVRELETSGATTADMMILFGQRAGPAMAALVSQGSEELANFTVELENAGGTAARIAASQMKGLGGALTELKSALEGLAISIAQSGILDFFTAAARKVTELVRSWSEANPTVLKWITIILGVVAALGPLILILGLTASALSSIIAIAPLMAAAWVMITGPIGLLIIGVGALVGLTAILVGKWEEQRDEAARVRSMIVDLTDATNADARARRASAIAMRDHQIVTEATRLAFHASGLTLQEFTSREIEAADAAIALEQGQAAAKEMGESWAVGITDLTRGVVAATERDDNWAVGISVVEKAMGDADAAAEKWLATIDKGISLLQKYANGNAVLTRVLQELKALGTDPIEQAMEILFLAMVAAGKGIVDITVALINLRDEMREDARVADDLANKLARLASFAGGKGAGVNKGGTAGSAAGAGIGFTPSIGTGGGGGGGQTPEEIAAEAKAEADRIARAQDQFSRWAPVMQTVKVAQRALAQARRQDFAAARQVADARREVLRVEQDIADLVAPHSERLKALQAQARQLDIAELQKAAEEETDRERLSRLIQLERLRITDIQASKERELAAAKAVFDSRKVQLADEIRRREETLLAAQAELGLIENQIAIENLSQEITLSNLQKEFSLTEDVVDLRQKILDMAKEQAAIMAAPRAPSGAGGGTGPKPGEPGFGTGVSGFGRFADETPLGEAQRLARALGTRGIGMDASTGNLDALRQAVLAQEGLVAAGNGALIDRPTLALVGEKRQQEVVAPTDMIRRIVREESGGGTTIIVEGSLIRESELLDVFVKLDQQAARMGRK